MNGRQFVQRASIGAAIVLVMALVAGCSTSQTAGTAMSNRSRVVSDRPLVIALTSEPTNLNPIFLDMNAGNWKAFNGLIKYDKNLNPVPDLASSLPEVAADGRTVTVQLRQGVKFHDGRPFTAEDVVFTYKSVLDPRVATQIRARFDLAGSVQDVKAVDAHTVQFMLSRIDPAFIHKLYVGIAPKHLLEGKDLNTADFNRAPVGTGPYVFKEWRSGDRLIFEANPDYFAGAPAIKRLVYVFAPDDNGRAALLANNSIDATRLPVRLAERFRNDGRYKVYDIPSEVADLVVLPNEHPFLKDVNVRRAIGLAVNKDEMVQGVTAGYGQVAHTAFRPEHWAYTPEVAVRFDQARAAAMLDQAGWRDSNGDGIRDKDGIRASFTIMYLSNITEHQELALAMRSDLAKIGVEANVEGVVSPGYESRLKQDAWLHNIGQPYDPDLDMWVRFHSRFADDTDPSTNPANMRNAEVDRALEDARNTLDQARRRDAYIRLQRALAEDASWLFLTRRPFHVVVPSAIDGISVQLQASPHAFPRGISHNIEDWYWTE